MTSSSSSSSSLSSELGRGLGRALTELLRGVAPQWPMTPPPEEIVERHDTDAALVLAWQRALPRRVADAVAEDAAPVLLPDGSSLERARAEALLADKEVDRVYPPLRQPLARAARPFRRFLEQRNELLAGLVIDDDVIADDDAKALSDFVGSTTGEMTACRELLASLGGAELADEDAVARGLDLPGPAVFSERQLSALVRQALPALPGDARAVQRVAAPRSCAGHVIVDDGADGSDNGHGTVRLWTAPTLTAGRFLAGARGAGRLLAEAAHAPVHAPGLGLAVVDVESRRALGESKGQGTRALQIAVATQLLLARARAAVTLVALRRLDVDEEREEARGAVRAALGADGGDELAGSWLLPPLPDGRALRSPRRALLQEARAAVDVAASWWGLRDALDAGFLLRPRRLAGLRELPPPDVDPALAWRRLLGELL